MTLLESLLFGAVQGITEFLPVSSSGHIAIAEALTGVDIGDDSLAFTVLLHLGTLAAVLVVYGKEVFGMLKAAFTLVPKLFGRKFRMSEANSDERMLVTVFIATLPLIPGVMLEDKIGCVSQNVIAVGAILTVNSIVLFMSDRFSRESLAPEKVGARHALIVGIAQVFALFPGLSRSGTTVSAGLFQGFEREYALKFSFVMSVPAVAGACILDLPGFISGSVQTGDVRTLGIYFAGALTAALVGIASIKLFRFAAKKKSFLPFSIYSLAAGITAIAAGISMR